ncbi:MAG: c-type cytochrome [Rhabdaerophilum sp.]|jgi:cytochrome c|nr:cytochrome c family protein [Methylobacterium sp.]MCE2931773.1 cytochrome c family protein [Hyphomicrobiales bacterium]MCA3638813.1 cytochrome c family protein [Methylobacterium sp.]MCA3641418.1 cytochrome c family protein [Methylobacterium sp.]MCA3644988.1 cytochrome c family protein [Methylobacterium sp.]
MGSNEINKVAGAVLGMLTLAMGIGFLSGMLVHQKPITKAGYELPEPQAETAVAAAPAAPQQAEPIAKRLASASAEKGATAARKCAACHQFTKDGKNGQGPLLYNVVARVKGSAAGFNYSNALKERAAKGEKWDFESLDAFIANPKAYLPGTSMNYAGIARPDERADLISYMRQQADSPAPLPQ